MRWRLGLFGLVTIATQRNHHHEKFVGAKRHNDSGTGIRGRAPVGRPRARKDGMGSLGGLGSWNSPEGLGQRAGRACASNCRLVGIGQTHVRQEEIVPVSSSLHCPERMPRMSFPRLLLINPCGEAWKNLGEARVRACETRPFTYLLDSTATTATRPWNND